MRRFRRSILLAMMLSPVVYADELLIAVAANFTGPMQLLTPIFENATGHRIVASFGATGKFYAQIKNGAPFDVFLSADDETPSRLAREDEGIASSQFTYAKGKLVLWSADSSIVDRNGEILRKGGFGHIAIANPKLAPYGAAAVEALNALGVYRSLESKIVSAENISQALQFVKSGNASLGVLAMSQVTKDNQIVEGSAWIIPRNLYKPIKQDVIALAKGNGRPAVDAFLRFLQSDEARTIIRSCGYDL